MIILDTNVLSEEMKPVRRPRFIDGFRAKMRQSYSQPQYARRRHWQGPHCCRRAGQAGFGGSGARHTCTVSGRILPFDSAAASHYAHIVAARQRSGRPVEGFMPKSQALPARADLRRIDARQLRFRADGCGDRRSVGSVTGIGCRARSPRGIFPRCSVKPGLGGGS